MEITDRPTATWDNLRLRANMLHRLREFFDSRGFLEVETPILSVDTVVDRHLDPFWVDVGAEKNADRLSAGTDRCASAGGDFSNPRPRPCYSRLWLQTSPEFHMKRMLAAGAGPIYQVARVFRQGEIGPLHNPEFTMVEWYQPGDDMFDGMRLTAELCETLLQDTKLQPKSSSKNAADDRNGFLSYRDAFDRYVGIDPYLADSAELIAAVDRLGIQPPESLARNDRDGWLDLLMVERVQPNLGIDRPTLLYDYPASQAALACVRRDEGAPPVAERFELFVGGVELANGYHELLDADELLRRNASVNAQRVVDGKSPLPEDSRLLAAMRAGLPASVGVALGFDRLLMLAAGVETVAEVMAFPFDRA